MDNFDPITQADELARRKAVIDALAAKDIKNQTSRSGILGTLANYMDRGKQRDEAEAYKRDASTFQQQYSDQLKSGMNSYLDNMNGRPGEVLSAGGADALMNGDQDPGMLQAGVKADPRRAVVEAMTSRLPELQALGKAGMTGLNKQQEVTEHIVNGQLVVGPKGGAKTAVFGTAEQFGPVEQVGTGPDNKPLYGQRNKVTGEIKYSPGGGQTINIGEKGDAAMLEPGMKVLDKARTTVLSEQKNLDTAKRIYELSQDPQIISGPGATALTTLSAIGAKFGLNGPEAAAKTQALITDLASNALAKGQEMKGSFSDSDIKFLEAASGGKIELTPQVMQQVAALAYAAAHNNILAANNQYQGAANSTEQLRKASGMYPMPAVKHGNLDPSRFTDEEGTGYMKYNSPLTSAGSSKAGSGRTISLKEFLGGQ